LHRIYLNALRELSSRQNVSNAVSRFIIKFVFKLPVLLTFNYQDYLHDYILSDFAKKIKKITVYINIQRNQARTVNNLQK